MAPARALVELELFDWLIFSSFELTLATDICIKEVTCENLFVYLLKLGIFIMVI